MAKRARAPHWVDKLTIEENAKKKFGKGKTADQIIEFASTLDLLLEKKGEEEEGFSQEKMAKDLEIAAGTISSYRNGNTDPSLTNLISIAEYLNVDCHYLMTGVHPKNIDLKSKTGLSNKAIEVLCFLNSDCEDSEDKKRHKQIISLINLVLESSYPKIIEYQKKEKKLKHFIETNYPDINIDIHGNVDCHSSIHGFEIGSSYDLSNDLIPKPVDNIFSTMFHFIDPSDTELSFLDGDDRITIKGQAAVIDGNGDPTLVTLNELKRQTIFEQIKSQLNALAKEKAAPKRAAKKEK